MIVESKNWEKVLDKINRLRYNKDVERERNFKEKKLKKPLDNMKKV